MTALLTLIALGIPGGLKAHAAWTDPYAQRDRHHSRLNIQSRRPKGARP